MPARSETYRELWQQFFRPVALGPVLEGFRRIDELGDKGELTFEEASQLKASAFRAMREATTDDPASARRLILDDLLPLCLVGSPEDESEDRFARHHYRECLRDWLEALAEPARTSTLEEILDRL